jgi:hypothetical protein
MEVDLLADRSQPLQVLAVGGVLAVVELWGDVVLTRTS